MNHAFFLPPYLRGQSKFDRTLRKRPLDVWGRGGQNARRYKLQKGSRNRTFEIANYLIIPYSYFALFAQYSAYTPLKYTNLQPKKLIHRMEPVQV